jgi:hypothetical protein
MPSLIPDVATFKRRLAGYSGDASLVFGTPGYWGA